MKGPTHGSSFCRCKSNIVNYDFMIYMKHGYISRTGFYWIRTLFKEYMEE